MEHFERAISYLEMEIDKMLAHEAQLVNQEVRDPPDDGKTMVKKIEVDVKD